MEAAAAGADHATSLSWPAWYDGSVSAAPHQPQRQRPAGASAGTARSRRRALLFRLAALLMAPLLLVVAELALVALDWPSVQAPVLPQGWSQGTRLVSADSRQGYLETYSGAGGQQRVRSAARLQRDGFMQAVDYSLHKTPGTFRVFCFGGSATLGVPVEAQPEKTFPGRLQHLLREAGVAAEVINLGGASFGSDQVVELVEAVVTHQPDALVVYSGNNEFFNYALELARQNPGSAGALDEGSPFRLVRALHRLGAARRASGDLSGQDVDRSAAQRALVGAAARASLRQQGRVDPPAAGPERRVQRRDGPYRDVLQRYRQNLGAVARLAGLSGTAPTLYLVEVPANLLEPPWLSLHDPFLGSLARWRWQRNMQRGRALLEASQPTQAREQLLAAVDLDPLHAEGWYYAGLASLRAGEPSQALGELAAALELDVAPGRPLAAQGQALRELGEEPGARFVSTSANFEAALLARGDRGYFHDSCHLSVEGYDLLARIVARAILSAQPLAAPEAGS